MHREEMPPAFRLAVEKFISKRFEESLSILKELLSSSDDPKDRKFLEGFYEVVEGTKYVENLQIDLGYQVLRAGYLKLRSFYPAYKGVYLSKFLESIEDSLVELRNLVKS